MKEKIGDFYPFAYRVGEDSVVTRHLFLKQHEGKDDELKPSDRTLYIVNVPQYVDTNCLRHLFLDFGGIKHVYIHSKPTSSGEAAPQTSHFHPQLQELGSKVSYIVFVKPVSLKRVFKSKDIKIIPEEKVISNVGKSKWTSEYNNSFINSKELEDEVLKFMAEFDEKVEEDKKMEKMGEEPDEDGWVTVSKFSKKPKIPRIESVNKKLVAKQNAVQARLSLTKFYKNQLRDAKMEQILELRKKFEKDKAQIALMKDKRKFRPF